MKKRKFKKFEEGGKIDSDTYSRAKAFLRLQGIEDTPALDELSSGSRVRPSSASSRAEEVMEEVRRSRGRETPRVRAAEPVEIIGEVPSPKTRAAEPVEIIGEVEEVREPRNRASSIPSMESQRMEEKTTGERIRDVVGRGGATDIRNIAGALAGPAAGRVAAAAVSAHPNFDACVPRIPTGWNTTSKNSPP